MSIKPGESIERSVDSVQGMYAVVIALAISEAIEILLKGVNGTADLSRRWLLSGMWAFVAFVFTLIPFWHGMNRHLDRCYLEKEGDVRRGAILLDLFVFFAEAGFLFAAGLSLRSGLTTFYCLGGLLFVDMLWALGSHWIHFRDKKSYSLRWSAINVIAMIVAFGVIKCNFGPRSLMIVAVLRTIADYWICRDFYFPAPKTK
jgi:hypothetical protein